MKVKKFLISTIEGVLQGFCGTKFLLGLTFSMFASEMSLQTLLVIGCIVAIFTAIIYFLLIHKEQNNKNILRFSATSFLCFAISSPVFFALPFSIFPQREIGDAEGIFLILIFAFFFITAVIVRLGILVSVIFRNKKAQTLQDNPN